MEKEFVPYELALRMKQLGFNEYCLAYYTHNEKLCKYGSSYNDVDFHLCTHVDIYNAYSLAPTWKLAFKWFRDNYKAFHEVFIDCLPKVDIPIEEDLMFSFTIHLVIEDKLICSPREVYKTYEEAELACLEKLLEIVENKEHL